MENANLPREDNTSNMDTSFDIQGLVTSMREKEDNLSTPSTNCFIFRVPERLRQVNERAYTPVKFSIGPLHHGKGDLEPLEEHKWRYLKDFQKHSKKSLEYLVTFIKGKEKSIREFYAETIIFNSEKFVEIILVDAAFIIEVLLKNMDSSLQTPGDRIFRKPMMFLDIFRDILLLENQLPFFVLEQLFEMAKGVVCSHKNESTPTFIGFVCNFLAEFDNLKDIIPDDYNSLRVKHFVDLISKLHTTREDNQSIKLGKFVKSPTAMELHNASIKFNVSPSKNLLNINFMSGVLEIPKLVLSDNTECWIRNVIAFEQCLYNDRYMTQYVWFLDNLVDSSKDVAYLVESGVIKHWLGDNDKVSNIINKLSEGTILNEDEYCLSEICKQLNDHCKKSWHKWVATLRRDYFKTPWRIVSIVAAVILLSLTLIQTVCSIVSVGK